MKNQIIFKKVLFFIFKNSISKNIFFKGKLKTFFEKLFSNNPKFRNYFQKIVTKKFNISFSKKTEQKSEKIKTSNRSLLTLKK